MRVVLKIGVIALLALTGCRTVGLFQPVAGDPPRRVPAAQAPAANEARQPAGAIARPTTPVAAAANQAAPDERDEVAAVEPATPKPAAKPQAVPAKPAQPARHPQAVVTKPAPAPPAAARPPAASNKAEVARQAVLARARETPEAPAVASPAPAAGTNLTLHGRVKLDAGPRQAVALGEVSEAVVYFLPQSGAPAPKPGKFSIDTRQKGFSPNLLVIPVGSTVAFPNTDTILHNVYSRTPGSEFDLNTYGPGGSGSAVLTKPGLVIVNCNVHHNMRANLVVLATPYYTRPSQDGRFTLEGLPPGPGTLVFWHPRSRAVSQSVSAGNTGVVQALVATKPRLDAHMLIDN